MTSKAAKSESFQIFNSIAGRYDLVNSVLSFGLHYQWRRALLSHLPGGGDLRALDLATGTGDVAITLATSPVVRHIQGIDLSQGMLAIGREKIARRHLDEKVALTVGNAQAIPFPDQSFNLVTISFGIRNVADVDQCLRDCLRVLKPGGRMLVLEFGLPDSKVMRFLHGFYLRHVLPTVGRVLTGHKFAYRYLNETIEEFPHSGDFAKLMTKAGFGHAGYRKLTFGVVNLYWGDKI